jgi:hypothetical protein
MIVPQLFATSIASVVFFHNLGYLSAAEFECPLSTEQFGTEVKSDLTSHAQDFLHQNPQHFAKHIETTVNDLYSKYPAADRIVVIRDLMSVTCQIIRNSGSLSDDEKLKRWFQFVDVARSFLPPLPSEQILHNEPESELQKEQNKKPTPIAPAVDKALTLHSGASISVQAVGIEEPARLIAQELETQLQHAGFVVDPKRPAIILIINVETRTVGRRLDGPDKVIVSVTERSTNLTERLISVQPVQEKEYDWDNPNSSSRNVAKQLYSLLSPSMH